METKHTACVIGASGLIGGFLLQELLANSYFNEVRILVRETLPIQHTKLLQFVTDFNNKTNIEEGVGKGSHLFICIGTTKNKVKGNKDLYTSIDVDIPLNVASIAKNNGYSNVSLVSAVGANSNSSNFYLQLKGIAETKIAALQFKATFLYQPSLLLGKRNEERIGERIAQLIMPLFNFLFIGKFKKYKPIEAKSVAIAMIKNAIDVNKKGVFIKQNSLNGIR
jgi:uncharacterized protein YbjT (DUF2867 family)